MLIAGIHGSLNFNHIYEGHHQFRCLATWQGWNKPRAETAEKASLRLGSGKTTPLFHWASWPPSLAADTTPVPSPISLGMHHTVSNINLGPPPPKQQRWAGVCEKWLLSKRKHIFPWALLLPGHPGCWDVMGSTNSEAQLGIQADVCTQRAPRDAGKLEIGIKAAAVGMDETRDGHGELSHSSLY